MDFAYSFIIRNGGLDTEKDYKYKAADGVCNVAKEHRHVVTIDSYEDVPPMNEAALQKVRACSGLLSCWPARRGAGCSWLGLSFHTGQAWHCEGITAWTFAQVLAGCMGV